MTEFLENRVYDEIQIGQTAEMQRTLARDDIALFSKVSGDLNPIHVDAEYAQDRGAKGVVGHSLWATGLVSSLLANVLPGPGTVYRRQDAHFYRQVALGDSLTARVKVLEKLVDQEVILECRVVNQHGETVMNGIASVIAPTEPLRIAVADVPEVTVRHHDSFAVLFERVTPLAPIPNCSPPWQRLLHDRHEGGQERRHNHELLFSRRRDHGHPLWDAGSRRAPVLDA